MQSKNNIFKIAIWAFALAVIYLTVGVIVSYVILEQIAQAINAHATLFGEWYQTLMFVLDIVCFIGLVGSIVMFIKTREKHSQKAGKGFVKSFFDKTIWGGISVFMAILTVIVYVGASVANQYAGNINDALGITTMVKVDVDDSSESPIYVPSDYYNADGSYNDKAMRANSLAVAEEAASESTVLLWNNDNALPLKENAKIGVFGMAQLKNKYFYTGTGSGYLNPQNGIDTTLAQELRSQNLQVFKGLETAYIFSAKYGMRQISRSEVGLTDINYSEARINEMPWNEINATKAGNVTDNYTEYEDAAVMIIQRYGGETLDLDFNDGAAPSTVKGDDCVDGNYLDLSANEITVLSALKTAKEQKKIKKIILLINSANAVQFKSIKNYDIDACMWVGMGGNAGFKQIANALTGKITPSGRLVDTYVYDNYSAPATENFGDFTFEGQDGVNASHPYTWNTKYIVYSEGIYLGYRYYETRYEDAVLSQGNASGNAGVKAGSGNWKYTDEVAFPFGYGLSYTTFEYSDYKVEKKGENYEISVKVTNTGNADGKEVVQVYLQKPYTSYDKEKGIEKSSVELVGFNKTSTLKANGGSEVVKITVKAEEMRTYDSYGYKTYILEAGDYYFAVGKSSHDALNNILAAKGKTTADGMDYNGDKNLAKKELVAADDFEKYSKSTATGYNVTNLFDNADINLYEGTADQHVTYLTRNDWQGTYPKPVKMRADNAVMKADMAYGVEPVAKEGDEMPSYGKTSEKYGPLNLLSMMEVDYYDEEKWNAFMDQTTWEEQVILVTTGAHIIKGIASVGAPEGKNQNGPSGLNQPNPTLGSVMAFPSEVNLAATFNTELVYRVGDAFGMEMMHANHTSLNGLGADLHRSAFSGRNWEYYSEDAFMTGAMLSAQSKGLQHRGIILFTKHFIMNDQERNRYGVTTWANEQTIRELHAKGIEMAVTSMQLNGIMSSFNRVGCVWSGRHEGLLTTLLRKEWGFTGAIETDAAVGIHMTEKNAMANAVCAGQDLWLMGGKANAFDDYKDNPTVALAVREAARRILYAELHANVMNGVKATTMFVSITPWWKKALVMIKIIATSVTILCLCYFALSFFVQSKAFGKKAAEAAAESDENTNVAKSVNGEQKSAYKPVSGAKAFVANNSKAIVSVTALVLAIAVTVVSIVGSIGAMKPEDLTVKPGASIDTDNSGGGTSAEQPSKHECTSVCPLCGGCMNDECKEEACKVKCGKDRKHVYTFEAEDERTILTSGDRGKFTRVKETDGKKDLATDKPVGCLGNVNINYDASAKFSVTSVKAQTATLKLRISANYNVRVTDSLYIAVNDELISRKSDLKIVPSVGSSWWYFVEVNLGCIKLKEGENVVELTSMGNNGNIDCIKICADEEVKWSENITPPEEEKLTDINTENDDSAWTKTSTLYAVEEAGKFASYVKTSGSKPLSTPEERANAEGKLPIGDIFANKGATVTFYINASVAGTVGLYAEFCNRNKDFKFGEWGVITVNGKKYTSTATMPKGEEWTPSNTFTRLGFIDLGLGLNEISVSVKDSDAADIYGLKFTSETVEVTAGEVPSAEVENINVSFDDAGWKDYVFYALNASGELESNYEIDTGKVTIDVRDAKKNTAGVGCLGNLDMGKGKTITVRFNASKAGKVGLYLELGNLKNGNNLCDWADITLNGKKYTSDAAMPTGTNYTPSNKFVKVGFIELKEGLNKITFTVNSSKPMSAHNFYGIKFTSSDITIEKGTKA